MGVNWGSIVISVIIGMAIWDLIKMLVKKIIGICKEHGWW